MNKVDKIKALGKDLLAVRQAIEVNKTRMDELKQKKDVVQSKLIAEMSANGLQSIKTDTHNFAVTTKKDVSILDPSALTKWIANTDQMDVYMPRKIDALAVKSMARQMLKTTGEVLAGCEPVESIYMSIKTNK